MGCDIHTHVEQRTSDGWKLVIADRDRDGAFSVRSYELFEWLSGVRSEDRWPKQMITHLGLPKDATVETREGCEDNHSRGWFTLAEASKWTWPTKVKRSGWVDPETARKLDEGIEPTTWCKGTSDESYVFREWIGESPWAIAKFKAWVHGLHRFGACRVIVSYDS